MQNVIEGVYTLSFFGGFLNIYLIEQGDSFVVIDTGMSAGQIDRLEAALSGRGRSMDAISHILITHAHPDHVGGLPALQAKATSSVTYAHRQEARVIRGEMAVISPRSEDLTGFSRVMYAMMPTPSVPIARVSKEIAEGDSLDDVVPGLQVIDLPGHAPGHIGFWWPERRVLFAGDAMMRYLGGLRMPIRAASVDWDGVKESIKRVAALDVDVLCLGHGRPITSNANEAIRALTERI